MFDDPPVRDRADQPGQEYADVRNYHDWTDVEGKPWEDAPEPPQDAPRPALRVVVDPDEAEAPTEWRYPHKPTNPDGSYRDGWWRGGVWEDRPPPNPAVGFRTYLKRLLAKVEAGTEVDERPPWER